jgi:hypothetical protein
VQARDLSSNQLNCSAPLGLFSFGYSVCLLHSLHSTFLRKLLDVHSLTGKIHPTFYLALCSIKRYLIVLESLSPSEVASGSHKYPAGHHVSAQVQSCFMSPGGAPTIHRAASLDGEAVQLLQPGHPQSDTCPLSVRGSSGRQGAAARVQSKPCTGRSQREEVSTEALAYGRMLAPKASDSFC